MNSLSATHEKVLNNLTKVLSSDAELGTLLQSILATIPSIGTPVNAVAASGVLTLTGVVKHRETVTISNPLVTTGTDTYEFLADDGQVKSDPTYIGIDIREHTTEAGGVLDFHSRPVSGDTFTIGANVYIYVPEGTANHNGEISIGANIGAARANTIAAINGTDGVNVAHPDVKAAPGTGNLMSVFALVRGTDGNAIDTTGTFTDPEVGFGGAHLTSGADCSAANAITHLVAAITASDTQGVGAADGTDDTVDLTADTKGILGNDIVTTTTLANGSFEHAHLTGGIDGTPGLAGKILIDSDKIYVATDDCSISDSNWTEYVDNSGPI